MPFEHIITAKAELSTTYTHKPFLPPWHRSQGMTIYLPPNSTCAYDAGYSVDSYA